MANDRFKGMTAIVTGGGSGIGFAVAERMVAEGGEVLLWDIDQRRLDAATAKLGGKTRARRVDVTDPDEVERAAEEADAAWARIDALVCSAGVAGPTATLIDYPIGEWKRVFDINVNGLFYCNRFVARAMKARGYGRIVNVASIAGKEGNPNASAYSASKAAVIGLTKSLGKELAKDGVTVNAVAPATIETPILEQVTPEFIAYMRSKIPMERFATLDEAASLICMAREPRMLVLDRGGVRPFGRPGNVLTPQTEGKEVTETAMKNPPYPGAGVKQELESVRAPPRSRSRNWPRRSRSRASTGWAISHGSRAPHGLCGSGSQETQPQPRACGRAFSDPASRLTVGLRPGKSSIPPNQSGRVFVLRRVGECVEGRRGLARGCAFGGRAPIARPSYRVG